MPEARRPGAGPGAPASQVSSSLSQRSPQTPGQTGPGGFDLRPSQREIPARTPSAPPTPAARPVLAPSPRPSAVPVFPDLGALRDHALSCQRCILHGKRKSILLEGGAKSSSWAVLTLYAWADDADRGQLLSGSYASAFFDLVRASGLPDPIVLPILACSPTDPADTTIQGFTEALKCKPHWAQALRLHGVKAVLVLDHKASQLVRGPSAPIAWPAFRGEVWSIEGIPSVSTHHPARLSRSASLAPEVASDLERIKSLLEKTP
jgi:uracil-DNA glycosylase